ncbi:MAG: amino acid adenylation domain-containing protein [Cyanobacteria bacterium P01_D01_bin.123]
MELENVEDLYPLSPVQQGMLFHSLTAPDSGVYIGQYTCKLRGALNPEFLKQAWQQAWDRHPILRTMFVWELDEPLQIVRQQVELPWHEKDWRDRAELELARKTFLQQDRGLGFALDCAPLTRFTLIRLSDDTYELVWTCHHLLTDGWSTPLIWDEVYACYAALVQGHQPELPEPKPYRDYIAWLQERDWTSARQFWTALLAGFTEPTPLPGERGVANASSTEACFRSHLLDTRFLTALQDFGRTHRLTLSTLINGAWALVLSRYSGERDIVFGLVVSGRSIDLADIESRIGLFVNTLPVRVEIAESTELVPWLQDLQRQALDARAYEATPLSDIQTWSDIAAGDRLFSSLVAFENQPTTPQTHTLGFEVSDIDARDQSNYPLVLVVMPGKQLELRLIFDPRLVSDEVAKRILAQFETLLQGFVEHPQTTLSELPCLTKMERQLLLHDWNQTQAPLPEDICIHHRFETQVERVPEAVAIAFAGERLTYRALEQQVNQLAHYLKRLGVTTNTRVAICLERSSEAIVAILAVLKAGGAYVPLDPAYPPERLQFVLEDANVAVLVTRRVWLDVLSAKCDRMLCLDDEADAIAKSPTHAPSSDAIASDSLAYIIYTSGSTGKPKGVPVEHRNLVHSIEARVQYYPEAVRSFLLLSSLSFDSSVAGIFWTLCQGGTLVLPRQHMEQDLQHLAHLIATHNISHTLCLPTLYALLLADASRSQLQSLQVAIVAGEACPRSLAQQHYAMLPQTTLYNEYGPTETTVWCSAYRIAADSAVPSEAATIPIGKPVANTQIYILDDRLRPVPIGAAGELYVGGAGVTRGYLNRPEQTQLRFVANPFSLGGEYLYRTGDVARYRADGNLEWLGRRDRQVKIRGHRIELGEIEDALLQHPDVREVAVIATEAAPASPVREQQAFNLKNENEFERLVDRLTELEPWQAEELLGSLCQQPVEASA